MLVGNGMIAKQFANYKDCEDVLIFASGVSNSKETLINEFVREFNLLKESIKQNARKHFVYFGTSSMYDPAAISSPYVLHKIAMEQYVIDNCESYNIFRISQIIGRSNNQTLANFIVNNIVSGQEFEVWKYSTRNFIALDDVYKIIDYILNKKILKNKIINIANSKNIAILEFIKIVEKILCKSARMKKLPKGLACEIIDISLIEPYLSALNINFSDDYYENSLSKMLFES